MHGQGATLADIINEITTETYEKYIIQFRNLLSDKTSFLYTSFTLSRNKELSLSKKQCYNAGIGNIHDEIMAGNRGLQEAFKKENITITTREVDNDGNCDGLIIKW